MVTDGIIGSSIKSALSGASSGGASIGSADRFQQAYARASEQLGNGPGAVGNVGAINANGGVSSLLNPLLGLNTDSTRLAAHASSAAKTEMRPSELMMLTMRSHEFLFHCELVSNVANRSSDGVQQLFRQQS